MAVPTVGVNP